MRVVDFKKSHYTLQDLVTGKNKSFHLTQIKPSRSSFDEMDIDPAVIARAEQQEFLVENILAHRKTPGSNKRTDFEFLVKWRRYDKADNTWEPWEFVERTTSCLSICTRTD